MSQTQQPAGAHHHPDDLYGMTWAGDTWTSSCQVCGWRGTSAPEHTGPLADLNTHLLTDAHRDAMKSRRDESRQGQAQPGQREQQQGQREQQQRGAPSTQDDRREEQ